jgi:hypothetical protein
LIDGRDAHPTLLETYGDDIAGRTLVRRGFRGDWVAWASCPRASLQLQVGHGHAQARRAGALGLVEEREAFDRQRQQGRLPSGVTIGAPRPKSIWACSPGLHSFRRNGSGVVARSFFTKRCTDW